MHGLFKYRTFDEIQPHTIQNTKEYSIILYFLGIIKDNVLQSGLLTLILEQCVT